MMFLLINIMLSWGIVALLWPEKTMRRPFLLSRFFSPETRLIMERIEGFLIIIYALTLDLGLILYWLDQHSYFQH
jgi:hypothetical protein